MVIKTKSYQLPKSTYLWTAFTNLIKKRWWVIFLLAVGSGVLIYLKKYRWSILPTSLIVLYLLFYLLQFYAVTMLEQNQLFFKPLRYQISSKEIVMAINTKQGMPIAWKQIEKAYVGAKHCVLYLSSAHFLYIPYRLLKSDQEKQFLFLLLKKNGLMKS